MRDANVSVTRLKPNGTVDDQYVDFVKGTTGAFGEIELPIRVRDCVQSIR